MKWDFNKLLWIIGRFFFWLSLLMVLLFVIVHLVLPNTYGLNYQERMDVQLKGDCYSFQDDLGPEVSCGKVLAHRKLIEHILNFPKDYILTFILAPYFALYKISDLHGATARANFDFGDYTIIIVALVILLAYISVFYYILKSIINIIRKFRRRQGD